MLFSTRPARSADCYHVTTKHFDDAGHPRSEVIINTFGGSESGRVPAEQLAAKLNHAYQSFISGDYMEDDPPIAKKALVVLDDGFVVSCEIWSSDSNGQLAHGGGDLHHEIYRAFYDKCRFYNEDLPSWEEYNDLIADEIEYSEPLPCIAQPYEFGGIVVQITNIDKRH